MGLPELKLASPEVRLSYRPTNKIRRPVAVSAGPIPKNVAMPHPDLYDDATTISGVIKRIGSKVPDVDDALLSQFAEFVKDHCRKNYKPLPSDIDLSLVAWLDETNYPKWRKEELQEKNSKITNPYDKKYHAVKSHNKDETYVDYKHVRGINSRTDEYKTLVGPIFKHIEREVFKDPVFIKKVPVAERANYIHDRLYDPGAKYFATDYTSFEASFSPKLMLVCEIAVYDYFVQNLPKNARDLFRYLVRVMIKRQRMYYKNVFVELLARRMSGEMCTSLGNGLTNMLVCKFLCKLEKLDVIGVFEGDDALCRTVQNRFPSQELFAKLGFVIKIEVHDDLSHASFCGLLFDPDEKLIVTDPRECLASMGWCQSKYTNAKRKKLKALLRCKALSYAHQYPGCPIIQEFAHSILRCTRDVQPYDLIHAFQGGFDMWFVENNMGILFKEPVKKVCGPNTRRLIEEQFGISVRIQLLLEQQFRTKSDLLEIDVSMVDFPDSWYDYYNRYVIRTNYVPLDNIQQPLCTAAVELLSRVRLARMPHHGM